MKQVGRLPKMRIAWSAEEFWLAKERSKKMSLGMCDFEAVCDKAYPLWLRSHARGWCMGRRSDLAQMLFS